MKIVYKKNCVVEKEVKATKEEAALVYDLLVSIKISRILPGFPAIIRKGKSTIEGHSERS